MSVDTGRDLTADDVRNVMPTHSWSAAEIVADRLNRIARPSGQPDAAEPRTGEQKVFSVGDLVTVTGTVVAGLADGVNVWLPGGETVHLNVADVEHAPTDEPRIPTAAEIVDEYEASQRPDWTDDARPDPDGDTGGMLAARDDLRAKCGDTGEIIAHEHNERGYLWWTETRVYGAKPERREIRSLPRNPSADRSPRSWSLPAPPPDDVTVEYRVTVTRSDGAVLTTYSGDDRYVAERMAGADGCRAMERTVSPWRELPVVEGEPPAPEPVFAVGDRVRSKSGGALGTVTEVGRGQALDERRVSFVDGWDRWIDVSDLERGGPAAEYVRGYRAGVERSAEVAEERAGDGHAAGRDR